MPPKSLDSSWSHLLAKVYWKNTQIVTFSELLKASISDRMLKMIGSELFQIKLIFEETKDSEFF